MTLVEIICVSLLSVFIVMFIVGFVLDFHEARLELEREKKIDRILSFIEKDMADNVFPEFKDGKE